ncbi:uncharacterized [Lates japonicus]
MACIASEGADVFTQLRRDANTVTQLHKTSSSLADHSSAPACPRHNISALQLISVHPRIIKSRSSFPVLHPQSFLASATVAVQQQQPASQISLSISPPSLSIHIHSK